VRPCDRGRSVGNPASCKWVGIVPFAGRWRTSLAQPSLSPRHSSSLTTIQSEPTLS